MTPSTTAPDPTSLKRAREHFEIAVRHHQRNELPEAETAYRRAIECNPRLAEAHNNLGVVLRSRGEDDAALDAFRTAVALRPTYAEALNNVALALVAAQPRRIRRVDQALPAGACAAAGLPRGGEQSRAHPPRRPPSTGE